MTFVYLLHFALEGCDDGRFALFRVQFSIHCFRSGKDHSHLSHKWLQMRFRRAGESPRISRWQRPTDGNGLILELVYITFHLASMRNVAGSVASELYMGCVSRGNTFKLTQQRVEPEMMSHNVGGQW